MIQLTEDEIKSSWIGQEIKVTVICICYNQVKYIEKAVDSFLIQKTSFPFQIIVHDDASTDGTKEVLLEYKKKFPSIIDLILQTENKFSKKQLMTVENLWSKAKSEFVAFCEGDDFWIDHEKLEKQYEMLRNHSGIDLCFHAARKVNENGDMGNSMSVYTKNYFKADEIIAHGGGFIPTASWFFRTSAILSQPSWISGYVFADYFTQIWLAHRGGIIYSPDIMSAYRVNSEGSFVQKNMNINRKLEYCESMFVGLDKIYLDINLKSKAKINLRKRKIFFSHIKFFVKRFALGELILLTKLFISRNKSVLN